MKEMEMESESSESRCSSSSSASASMAEDRMVTEELEAAEALADLAQLAMRNGDNSLGTTTIQRVKSESPPIMEASESLTRSSDLLLLHPQERIMIVSPPRPEKACPSEIAEPSMAESELSLKIEKVDKLPSTSFVGSSGYSPLGCKSRRNLTEAEKEERRMRRILANRESARQTIRRRQALCEELTKKAADLASENDSLKREVEMATNEYQMLETTNKELKDQMEKVEKAEAKEIHNAHKPSHSYIPQSSASPLFLYNPPPIFWPPVSQYQNPVPFPTEQDSFVNSSNPTTPRPPFYVYPYPWFYHHPDHGTAPIQSQPLIFQSNEQDFVSPSRTPIVSRPVRAKPEPSRQEFRITDDLNEPPESEEQCLASSTTATIKQESNVVQLDSPPHIETGSDLERLCEPAADSCKKSAEAAAASAEARKRRKELTKLKNLHSRHCRMHC